MSAEKTRIVEEKMARLFSEKKVFSEHLFKWEDDSLPDKYDHNCFEYTDQPTWEEFQKALDYQRSRGDRFIKLEGDQPLSNGFGLEPNITVTMELNRDTKEWKRNEEVRFAVPSIEELEAIEVKHFGSLYGESFTRRNIHRLYEKLQYHGAYLGDTLVGACYSFTADGMICIDGLIVDEAYRHQYIATALIAHIAETNPGSTLFLHGDEADTPKEMYLKMGFEITDRLYEYSCTDMTLFADLDVYLRSGEWQITYESPTALMLNWNRGWLHALVAFDPDEARELLTQIPPEDAIVMRGCDGLRELASELGFNGCHPCWQVVYDGTTPIPISSELTIRHPDEKDFPKVAASYDMGSEEELREDFEGPDFLGGYLEEELVGYVGLHGEGSMGMLYVFPPYRRRGYAKALYGTLINNQLQKGRLPFAQIIEDNEASMQLHHKWDFRVADSLIYWMWREQ